MSEDCDGLQAVVAPSSGREPGTLQTGMRQSGVSFQASRSPVAVRSDGGLAYLACGGLVMLDPALHEIGRVDSRGPASVLVAPDDAMYGVIAGTDPATADIVALSPTGKVRWTAPIASLPNQIQVVAAAEGPYVGTSITEAGTPLPEAVIFALDAATGARRRVVTGQVLLTTARDGLATVDALAGRTTALHMIDLEGHAVWSHALASTIDGVRVERALATPDGGVIAFGSTPWTLDLGDRTLAVERSPSRFVAGFDAAGATTWALALDYLFTMQVAVSAQGEVLIASMDGGSTGGPEGDTYLSVVTPAAGILRTLRIDGPGSQAITGLAATRDGAAWIQVYNQRSDDNRPDPVMHIGDRTFADEGTYLFKLVP